MHTGELLCDNLVLHNAKRKNISSQASKIQQQLALMNSDRHAKQKELQQRVMNERLAKKQRNVNYVPNLAKTCKTWGGPCCSAEELKRVLEKNGDIDKKIVKTELSFYVHTHKSDRAHRPELFRLVNVDMATQLENLLILLSSEENVVGQSSLAEVALPTNEDALRAIFENPNNNEHDIFEVNKMCVSVWHEVDEITWYIGYFHYIKDDLTYVVEQLIRAKKGSDLMWIHPPSPILEDVQKAQILCFENGKLFELGALKGKTNIH